MRALKRLLEKPHFIWFLIIAAYGVSLFSIVLPQPPEGLEEIRALEALSPFSDGEFPPRIGTVREVKDIGHPAYYAIAGYVAYAVKGDIAKLRFIHWLVICLVFLAFVKLGLRYTYRNRLNPAWVSGALLMFAVNPYVWRAAVHVGYPGFLLLCLLCALWAFDTNRPGLTCLFTTIAVLTDWVALVLAAAMIFARLMEERGRVVRPLLIAYSLAPLVMAALLYFAWDGFLPQGDARTWLQSYTDQGRGFFQLPRLTYALAVLPLYTTWYTLSWGFKARTRALAIGAVAVVLAIPFFFAMPIEMDYWERARSGLEVSRGFVDQGALWFTGEYKNLVLFVPYVLGVFLLAQLALMDILDRSRVLWFFILGFFALQPLLLGAGTDATVMFIIPFVLLLSLSEAMVGEEGNLMR